MLHHIRPSEHAARLLASSQPRTLVLAEFAGLVPESRHYLLIASAKHCPFLNPFSVQYRRSDSTLLLFPTGKPTSFSLISLLEAFHLMHSTPIFVIQK